MNAECRISKEGIPSILSKKIDIWIESTVRSFILRKSEQSDSTLRHSTFDIRYSAVRFSSLYFIAFPIKVDFSGVSKIESTFCPMSSMLCAMRFAFCQIIFERTNHAVVCI